MLLLSACFRCEAQVRGVRQVPDATPVLDATQVPDAMPEPGETLVPVRGATAEQGGCSEPAQLRGSG